MTAFGMPLGDAFGSPVDLEFDLPRSAFAVFSPDRRHRYLLRRSFSGCVDDPAQNPIVFLMLNPSTADAFIVDPTVKRCLLRAAAMGHSDVFIVNLFAIRETDSKKLASFHDRVGALTDDILAALTDCPIIAGWGAHPLARERADAVVRLVKRPLLCLRTTKSGAPEHPLYVPAAAVPVPWAGYLEAGATT